MNFNYKKICLSLLRDLPERQKQVISRRYGLETGERETLESIGRDFGITRERVRQIENDGFSKLKPRLESLNEVFSHFAEQLKSAGEIKREEVLLSCLGGKNYQPHVFFLLTLGEQFQRVPETKEFHPFWTINPDSQVAAQKVVNSFYQKLENVSRPITLLEYKPAQNMSPEILESFLEVSKIIQKNEAGFFGLKDWPEINPRNIRDKAFSVFKKETKPLHFRKVAGLIGPDALPQTVHNELIKDPRFVLVGRGIYALREWGYEEGDVKQVISKILKEAKKPLPKEKVLSMVKKQRLVKESTILLNLGNKKYFFKTPEGKYAIRKA
jgi:hypothetical protein